MQKHEHRIAKSSSTICLVCGNLLAKDELQSAVVTDKPVVRYTYCYNSHRDLIRSPFRHVPSMDGYLGGDELTVAWEGEIEGSLTKETMDDLFYLFNAPGARPERYRGPSMSVGDVVLLSYNNIQVAYACERPSGWRRVDPGVIGISPMKPRPAEWYRNDVELEEYRRLLAMETR